jgi:trimethylamine:corrinoid methyltransferase-like protein
LSEGHTFNFFKKELYETKVFDRTAHETWANRGKKDAGEVARERVKEILKRHQPKPLDEKAKSKISEIL